MFAHGAYLEKRFVLFESELCMFTVNVMCSNYFLRVLAEITPVPIHEPLALPEKL